jgi:hypothetical protein
VRTETAHTCYVIPSVALRGGKPALDTEAFAILYNFMKLENKKERWKISEVRKFYYPFAVCNFGTEGTPTRSVAIDIGGAFWDENFLGFTLDRDKADRILHGFPDKPVNLEDEPNSITALANLNSSFAQVSSQFPVAKGSWFKGVTKYATASLRSPEIVFDEAHYDLGPQIAYQLAFELDRLRAERDYLIQTRALVMSKISNFETHLLAVLSNEKEYSTRTIARFVGETSPDVGMLDPLLATFTDDIAENIRNNQSSSERDMDSIEHLIQFERRELQRMGPLREQEFRNEIGRIQSGIEMNQAQLLSLYKVQKQIDEAMTNANNALRKSSEDMRSARLRLRQIEQTPVLPWNDGDTVYLKGLKNSKDLKPQAMNQNQSENRTKAAIAIDAFAIRKQIAEMALRNYDSIALRFKSDLEVAHEQIRLLRRNMGEVIDDLQNMVHRTNEDVQSLLREGRGRCESTAAERSEDYEMIKRQFLKIESPRQFIISVLEGAQALLPAEVNRHVAPVKERLSRLSKARDTIEPKFSHAISSCEESIKRIEAATFELVPNGIYFVPFWQIRWQDGNGMLRSTIYSLSELKDDAKLVPVYPELEFPPEKAPLPDPSGRKLILETEARARLKDYSLPKGAFKIGTMDSYSCTKEVRKLVK